MARDERRDFFISYAGPDRPWARWIAGVLEAERFTVELDDWDWPPGSDSVKRMNRALERASRVLTVLTPRYFNPASWGGEEASAAMFGAHEEEGHLVPVLVETVERLPPLLRPLVKIVLTELDEKDARRQLVDRLQNRTGRGEEHPFPGRATADDAEVESAHLRPVRFPTVPAQVWNVPVRNPDIAGQDRTLELLHMQLIRRATGAMQAPRVIGGPVTTELAVEYAHRFAGDYDLVWWISADERRRIAGQFTELANRMGLEVRLSDEVAVSAVLDQLRGQDRWLLVFDSAEDPDDLAPYLPLGPRGHVLVTEPIPRDEPAPVRASMSWALLGRGTTQWRLEAAPSGLVRRTLDAQLIEVAPTRDDTRTVCVSADGRVAAQLSNDHLHVAWINRITGELKPWPVSVVLPPYPGPVRLLAVALAGGKDIRCIVSTEHATEDLLVRRRGDVNVTGSSEEPSRTAVLLGSFAWTVDVDGRMRDPGLRERLPFIDEVLLLDAAHSGGHTTVAALGIDASKRRVLVASTTDNSARLHEKDTSAIELAVRRELDPAAPPDCIVTADHATATWHRLTEAH